MNNNSGVQEGGGGRHRQWDAQKSLRGHTRNASEESPLLSNGISSSSRDSSEESEETLWEGHADFEGLTWWHKPSVFWLLLPFFMFALAIGGIAVPKLNLTLSLICRSYLAERYSEDPSFLFAPVILGSDNPQCRIPEVQSLATKFTLYITIITGILSALMSPKLGALSDRHGRLRFLVVTSVGAFLGEIITILAAKYPDVIPYQWLLAGAVFDGLCGSFTAGMALTHAYAADCTAPPKRAVAFSYFHACLFSGIALGPLLAAIVIKLSGNLIMIFYIALGVHAFFIFFILLIVPESLTPKRQQLAREKYAAENVNFVNENWISALRRTNPLAPLKILWPSGEGSHANHLRANIVLLASVDTIIFGVAMGVMAVIVYYSGYQFGWQTADTSLYVSAVNTTRVFALIVIFPIFNYFVRTRPRNKQLRESRFERNSGLGADSVDLAVIRISVFIEILGFLGFALARTGTLFTLAGILCSLGGIGSPTLQSALTKLVPQEQVGQLLGASGLLHALARVVCPTIFNLIYAQTVGTFPQTVFVVLTGCFVLAFTLTWFIRPNISIENAIRTRPTTGEINNDPDVLLDEEVVGG